MVYDFPSEAEKIIPGGSVRTGSNLHPECEDEPRVGHQKLAASPIGGGDGAPAQENFAFTAAVTTRAAAAVCSAE